MEKKITDNGLTIFLEGRIDTANADDTEREASEIRKEFPEGSLTFDVQKLEYISSAGLRLLMKFKKRERTLEIVNASPQVYDIFSMTGFTNILTIKKALRKIDVSGLEVYGRVGQGIIYRLDSDTIVKVFSEGIPNEMIETELNKAKSAFLGGVPTTISYDMVDCGTNYGIVYETINAVSLSSAMNKADDAQLEGLISRYTEFIKEFQNMKSDFGEFENIKSVYHRNADMLLKWANRDEVSVLHEIIDNIRECETLLHGDPHPGNIILKDGEILFIDMTEISTGPVIIDMSAVYRNLITSARNTPDLCRKNTGLDPERAIKVGYRFFEQYTGISDSKKMEQYMRSLGVVFAFNVCANIGFYASFNDYARQQAPAVVENVLRKIVLPNKDLIEYML